jgi:hypothetical protein
VLVRAVDRVEFGSRACIVQGDPPPEEQAAADQPPVDQPPAPGAPGTSG